MYLVWSDRAGDTNESLSARSLGCTIIVRHVALVRVKPCCIILVGMLTADADHNEDRGRPVTSDGLTGYPQTVSRDSPPCLDEHSVVNTIPA